MESEVQGPFTEDDRDLIEEFKDFLMRLDKESEERTRPVKLEYEDAVLRFFTCTDQCCSKHIDIFNLPQVLMRVLEVTKNA